MICPFCKEEIADGAIKCKHCSSMIPIEQTKATPGSAICPFCQEEIADGAIKCKHCKSMLNSQNSQSLVEDDNTPIEQRIENLNISKSAKKKLLLIHSKGGKPLTGFAAFNILAFFFTFIYYFVCGMWKKGLSLLGLWIAIVIVIDLLGPAVIGERYIYLFNILGLSFAAFCATYADRDRYRHLILKEDFWW